MKIESALEAVKQYNPKKILTEPDEIYETLQTGEIVVDFDGQLMMCYSSNDDKWRISYVDWVTIKIYCR